ncbi:unnamed protein product [Pleuronectes platessa]|uniref:Uncharacterized protein n=1 Tax=Pleuronectes platessa TaxID=8262 RepID=A0A9N7TVL8_PLEPL|nr:unnamed protein product [Pleuronectes platessa]
MEEASNAPLRRLEPRAAAQPAHAPDDPILRGTNLRSSGLFITGPSHSCSGLNRDPLSASCSQPRGSGWIHCSWSRNPPGGKR